MSDLPVKSLYKGSMLNNEIGLVTEGHAKDWLVAKHPDGQWVTLVKLDDTRPTPKPIGDVEGEEKYPCADCGKLRTKDEGGTTFTVCDECWDKHYSKNNRPTIDVERLAEVVKTISCGDLDEFQIDAIATAIARELEK